MHGAGRDGFRQPSPPTGPYCRGKTGYTVLSALLRAVAGHLLRLTLRGGPTPGPSRRPAI